ncbi:outer spore coat protein CotE [Desulfolucanica intricata]|uniref:outer spore coat protein CotE n=1 Tax=Desulfolucanica intricata TaxID=1285191 RepID=UPI0008356506|nr:outer spore coat protein CotE [Desulfolucanica intricata]
MDDIFLTPEKSERKKATTSNKKTVVREIITKAICGSDHKNFLYSCDIEFSQNFIPTQILGTSITGFELNPATVEAYNAQKPIVTVTGSFDVNVWFSYNNGRDTEIAKEVVEFTEEIEIEEYDQAALNELEARAVLTKTPQCKGAVIQNNNTIKVDVEFSIYTEVVGETKIKVQCYKSGYEEEH